jgi:hypothetical protein
MNHQRYLGLELSGAKNAKTNIAVLEYYPKEKKVFLLDIHSGIGADTHGSSDDALIESILDHADGKAGVKMGVSAPLTLPPCLTCTKKACSSQRACALPEVKWMKTFFQKHSGSRSKRPVSKKITKQKDFFTAYTQRPVELWLRWEVLNHLPEKVRFELDETLGGNRAPLTARMHYLKKMLQKETCIEAMVEVLPKLTVALLMPSLKLTYRHLRLYRSLEEGVSARQTILERMCDQLGLFIYDRDLKKLTTNLNAFDAFLCAYTTLLKDRGECMNAPKGFPVDSGWVSYPKSPLLDPRYSVPMTDHDDDDEKNDEGSTF